MSKPPDDPRTNEQYYYDVLRRIARYDSPDRIFKVGAKEYGLEPGECLEYAYSNVLDEARIAIKGMRRPKDKKP